MSIHVAFAGAAVPQGGGAGGGGGGGIRGPSVATAGGTIEVEVGTNDPSVEVVVPGAGVAGSHPVMPGKKAVVPVPHVPVGTVLLVTVGRGLQKRVLLVEVVD